MKTPEEFLTSVDSRSFRIAEIAIENAVDAMEILQKTMLLWVKKCSHKPSDSWQVSFYTILCQEICNFQNLQIKLPRSAKNDYEPGSKNASNEDSLNAILFAELSKLSLEQQQTFLLSEWLKFDTAKIAEIINQSVSEIEKYHAQAVITLKNTLRETLSDKDFSESDDALLKLIQNNLETSLKQISYAQQHELKQIRAEAFSKNHPKPILKWMIIIGIFALSLFTFWVLQMPDKTL